VLSVPGANPRPRVPPTVEDHWIALSDFERERFERRADFLIDQGYITVDPLTLAVRIARKMRTSPQPEGLVYEDGSRPRRAID
jgi:hypothetical protein